MKGVEEAKAEEEPSTESEGPGPRTIPIHHHGALQLADPAVLSERERFADFELPPALEASEPPEARGVPRDAVRMMVSRRRTGEITHHAFTDLPGLLLPGDLLVVNTSATLPAAVRCGPGLVMHFSTALPDGSWLAELRAVRGHATQPFPGGSPGQELPLPGGHVGVFVGGKSQALLGSGIAKWLTDRDG